MAAIFIAFHHKISRDRYRHPDNCGHKVGWVYFQHRKDQTHRSWYSGYSTNNLSAMANIIGAPVYRVKTVDCFKQGRSFSGERGFQQVHGIPERDLQCQDHPSSKGLHVHQGGIAVCTPANFAHSLSFGHKTLWEDLRSDGTSNKSGDQITVLVCKWRS